MNEFGTLGGIAALPPSFIRARSKLLCANSLRRTLCFGSLRELPVKTSLDSDTLTGTLGGIRTPDARLRTAALYPCLLYTSRCV